MSDEWAISLPSWALADGNYPDFLVGQRAEFALEFFAKEFQTRQVAPKRCEDLGHARYDIAAEVVYAANDAWIIDFGLRAFCAQNPPAGITIGMWVVAEVDLSVDPFYYSEELSQQEDFPALTYSWDIFRIEVESAPYVRGRHPSGALLLTPDFTRATYHSVQSTRRDPQIPIDREPEVSLAFILHARRLDTLPIKPRRSQGLHYNR